MHKVFSSVSGTLNSKLVGAGWDGYMSERASSVQEDLASTGSPTHVPVPDASLSNHRESGLCLTPVSPAARSSLQEDGAQLLSFLTPQCSPGVL